MTRDGNGNFTRLYTWITDLANSIKITASRMDAEQDGIATALTNSLDRSAAGGGNILRNVSMSNHKFTALGSGSALTDSVNYDDVQSGTILFFGTTGGTSTVYTLAPSPSINAYDTGMEFTFKVNAASGATPTINISAKGAKNMKWSNKVSGAKISITTNDLQQNIFYKGVYDGTDVLVSYSQASTTAKGEVELLTDAELKTGTDTTRAATAAAILSLFNVSLRSSDGYLRLPCNVGGTFVELIIQWGIDTVNVSSSLAVNLPLTFPTASLHGIANLFESATGRTAPGYVTALSTTQITLHNSNSSAANDDISWIAIGY